MLNKASLGSDINVIEFFDSFLLMFILHLTCFHVEAKPKLTKDLFLFVLTLFCQEIVVMRVGPRIITDIMQKNWADNVRK